MIGRLNDSYICTSEMIKVLYLDRGFCAGPVIAYLREVRQPAVLACIIHPVRFQLHAFVSLFRRVIEERLGGVMAIPSSTPLSKIVND